MILDNVPVAYHHKTVNKSTQLEGSMYIKSVKNADLYQPYNS